MLAAYTIHVLMSLILTINRESFSKEQQMTDLYDGEVTSCMLWELNC